MPLNPDAVGTTSEPAERSWTSKDALLYALGVGAGASIRPASSWTSRPRTRQAWRSGCSRPSPRSSGRAGVAGANSATSTWRCWSTANRHRLHGEIPPDGTVSVTSTVAGMYDKGSGRRSSFSRAESVDADTGRPRLHAPARRLFIRGAGGFGGPRSPEGDEESELAAEPLPTASRRVVNYATRTDQALLYRSER